MRKTDLLTQPTRGSFVLDGQGKLPKGADLVCQKHGVYALLVAGRLLRFGESGSGFARIRNGFNHQLNWSTGKKNYAAYQFRVKYASKRVSVWFFSSRALSLRRQVTRRAIEAEMSFRHRLKSGRWPDEMVEIHFYNDMTRPELQFVAAVEKVLAAVLSH